MSERNLESLYGTSRAYTDQCRGKSDEARAALLAAVQELERDAEKLHYLLSGMFSQYENGIPCYDDPEEGGFIGNAIQLPDEDFDAIVNILNKREAAAVTAREGGAT